LAPSKPVKPHTPHPTPHTLPPGKTFSADPNYGGSTTWSPIRKEVDFIIQQVWPKFRLVYTDPTTGTPGTGSGIVKFCKKYMQMTANNC